MRHRARLGLALTLVALAVAPAPGAVAARAPAPDPAPRCLGKPATVVGQGSVQGTARADVIVTGPGPDRVDGGGGNDRICSLGGADEIDAGPGSDRIDAGPGDDLVEGDNGSDTVLAGPGADTVLGKRGNDRLLGGSGDRDFLDAGLGDDTLDGGPGALDQVIGGVGNDRLAGGPGDGDLLRPDYGRDTVDGGEGAHDTVSFAVSGQTGYQLVAGGRVLIGGGIVVDLAAGRAEGDGEDTLGGVEDVIGTPFNDKISGSADANALYGAGGIDELSAVGPGDEAYGGIGLDRCRAFELADSCELPETGRSDAVGEVTFRELAETGGRPRPFQRSVEVDLAGGPAAGSLTAAVDRPFGENPPGVEIAVGFAEGAWLVRSAGIPLAVGDDCQALSPETARCPLTGTPEAVLLSGAAGPDTLRLEPTVPATVSGFLSGYLGADTIEGGPGDDSLDGYRAREGDVLRGGPGDDALTGGGLLDGGPGSDLLIAYPCNGETIVGGGGIDSVSFARSDNGVEAEIGGVAGFAPGPRIPTAGCPYSSPTAVDGSVESIEGSTLDDVLRGDGGRNILLGRGGDDEVLGAGGDDFIVGGEGRDDLAGGPGEDRLYARDGARDRALGCAPGGTGDVLARDGGDPPGRGCRDLP